MAGGMFASHYESGGNVIEVNGKLYKQFYGETSTLILYEISIFFHIYFIHFFEDSQLFVDLLFSIYWLGLHN